MIFTTEKVLIYTGFKSKGKLMLIGVNGLSDKEMAYHKYGMHSIEIPNKLRKVIDNMNELEMVEFMVNTSLSEHHCILTTRGVLYKIRHPKDGGYKPFSMEMQLEEVEVFEADKNNI